MTQWTLITDFILIGGMSFLALSIFFLAKAKNHLSKKLLIPFFTSAFFFLLYYYSYLHKLRILGAIAVFFGHGMGFLLGPLLLFQLKSLAEPKLKILPSTYLQLLPFLLVWLFVSIPLSLSMAGFYREFVTWYAAHDYYINIPENIFFLYYIGKAYRYQRQINASILRHYSNLKSKDLNWHKNLLLGLAIVVILDTFCSLYELYFPMISWNIGTLIAFCFVLLYTFLGYKGMIQSQILLPEFLIDNAPQIVLKRIDELIPPKKNIGPLDNYTEEQIEQLKENLFYLLEHKKPYLDESLSLTDLAEEMRISSKKLSELLNQHLNKSFYQLINEYRIKEVIARMFLPEYDKYTLAGLAYECGFQSKATFNRIFKQKTGKSPSTYKQEFCKEK